MNQLSMFDDVPQRVPWLKEEMAYSLSYDQTKILKDIMRLYLAGQPFDVDCTYSKGVFWKKLPQPRLKFDIAPQYEDVVEASADKLPLEDEAVQSVIFDPPFMPTKSNVPGKIKARFTAFASLEQMWEFYARAIAEFWRVLAWQGILVIKCQDTVSGGKNHFSHYHVESCALSMGFTPIDLFILGSRNVLLSPNMRVQQHARKNHSFLLVYRKEATHETKPKTQRSKGR